MWRREFLVKIGLAVPAAAMVSGEVVSAPHEGGQVLIKRRRVASEYASDAIPITWHLNQKTGEILGTWAARCFIDSMEKALFPFQVRCVIAESDSAELVICQKEIALRDALLLITEFEKTSLRWEEIRWAFYSPDPEDLERCWSKSPSVRTQAYDATSIAIDHTSRRERGL